MSWSRGVEKGEHPDAAVELRVILEKELVGAEAADDVLRRVGPVDADDQLLGTDRHKFRLIREDLLALSQVGELPSIDRDGSAVHAHGAALVLDTTCAEVALRGEHVLAAPQEVPPPALGVEADEVIGQKSFVQRAPDPLRRTRQ
jgi:hypothetical protein